VRAWGAPFGRVPPRGARRGYSSATQIRRTHLWQPSCTVRNKGRVSGNWHRGLDRVTPCACATDPTLLGNANFGFVSRYKNGAAVPDGSVQFQFKVGDLNFHSNTQQWLVVNRSGANAQLKGTGTVTGSLAPGARPFDFMIWAGDGIGPGGADTFSIKIWCEGVNHEETVVYNNGAVQPIGGGSISLRPK
jgi:hypothetical protein